MVVVAAFVAHIITSFNLSCLVKPVWSDNMMGSSESNAREGQSSITASQAENQNLIKVVAEGLVETNERVYGYILEYLEIRRLPIRISRKEPQWFGLYDPPVQSCAGICCSRSDISGKRRVYFHHRNYIGNGIRQPLVAVKDMRNKIGTGKVLRLQGI